MFNPTSTRQVGELHHGRAHFAPNCIPEFPAEKAHPGALVPHLLQKKLQRIRHVAHGECFPLGCVQKTPPKMVPFGLPLKTTSKGVSTKNTHTHTLAEVRARRHELARQHEGVVRVSHGNGSQTPFVEVQDQRYASICLSPLEKKKNT